MHIQHICHAMRKTVSAIYDANIKDADQDAPLRSLTSAFVVDALISPLEKDPDSGYLQGLTNN